MIAVALFLKQNFIATLLLKYIYLVFLSAIFPLMKLLQSINVFLTNDHRRELLHSSIPSTRLVFKLEFSSLLAVSRGN